MEAIRLHQNSDPSNPYSDANPAPPSALVLDSGLPIPKPLAPGEIVIKVEAATVVRDSLTWPETYEEELKILGNDFAGTVTDVNGASNETRFKPGDEVYGAMVGSKTGTWSEYAVVPGQDTCLKPKNLSWAEAAAVPLSGLTAYQALFEHAGLAAPDFRDTQKLQELQESKKSAHNDPVLITGASGGVGLYMVQLANLAGLHVVAATRSNARNKEILTQLGADEIVEYGDLAANPGRFPAIIDTVGGKVLENSWSLAKKGGTIVTIDSASYDFGEEHKKAGLDRGGDNVEAKFFIFSPSQKDLEQLSALLDAKLLKPFVAKVMPLKDAALAYEESLGTPTARGKIVLTPGSGHSNI